MGVSIFDCLVIILIRRQVKRDKKPARTKTTKLNMKTYFDVFHI